MMQFAVRSFTDYWAGLASERVFWCVWPGLLIFSEANKSTHDPDAHPKNYETIVTCPVWADTMRMFSRWLPRVNHLSLLLLPTLWRCWLPLLVSSLNITVEPPTMAFAGREKQTFGGEICA